MIFVVPPATPVTTPDELIVPLLDELVVHNVLLYVPEPPLAFDDSVVLEPTHT